MSLDAAPEQISTEHQLARNLLREFMATHEIAPHVAIAAADAFLEATASPWPDAAPMFAGTQSDADWWVEFATGTQISAMLSACLKRLAMGQMILAPNARKRAMVAIWNSLNETDRAAFLTYAEPGPAGRS